MQSHAYLEFIKIFRNLVCQKIAVVNNPFVLVFQRLHVDLIVGGIFALCIHEYKARRVPYLVCKVA